MPGLCSNLPTSRSSSSKHLLKWLEDYSGRDGDSKFHSLCAAVVKSAPEEPPEEVVSVAEPEDKDMDGYADGRRVRSVLRRSMIRLMGREEATRIACVLVL